MDSGDGYFAFREMSAKIAAELDRKATKKKSAKRSRKPVRNSPSPPHKEQSDE